MFLAFFFWSESCGVGGKAGVAWVGVAACRCFWMGWQFSLSAWDYSPVNNWPTSLPRYSPRNMASPYVEYSLCNNRWSFLVFVIVYPVASSSLYILVISALNGTENRVLFFSKFIKRQIYPDNRQCIYEKNMSPKWQNYGTKKKRLLNPKS